MSSSPLDYEISPVDSVDDFTGFVTVERAAFGNGPLSILMFGNEDIRSEAAAHHARTQVEDTTARYVKAALPSGRIIGIAKWNFYTDLSTKPQNPFLDGDPFQTGNPELRKYFFGELDRKRSERMAGKRHYLMAILAVDPEFQRMGVGKRLLEWGLEKADAEGFECWIDASPAGKGLYEKMGWEQVDFLEVDLGKWGGEEGKKSTTFNMVRQPVGKQSKQ